MIHQLHALGSTRSQALLEPPCHVFAPSEMVAWEFHNKSLLAIHKDPGDEITEPLSP